MTDKTPTRFDEIFIKTVNGAREDLSPDPTAEIAALASGDDYSPWVRGLQKTLNDRLTDAAFFAAVPPEELAASTAGVRAAFALWDPEDNLVTLISVVDKDGRTVAWHTFLNEKELAAFEKQFGYKQGLLVLRAKEHAERNAAFPDGDKEKLESLFPAAAVIEALLAAPRAVSPSRVASFAKVLTARVAGVFAEVGI